VTRVAVIAHRGKTLGGGLPELRRVLEERGVTDVFWREVGKSRFAPTEVRKALARKVDLVFVWDKKMAAQFGELTAKDWFAKKPQLRRDDPNAKAFAWPTGY